MDSQLTASKNPCRTDDEAKLVIELNDDVKKNNTGRMRKLSMNELNRHRGSQGRKYKFAFYTCLVALCVLFLYLIYQNLFNDR